MNIKIIWIGKTKNIPIRDLSADYLDRIRCLIPCEVVETRDLSKARGLRGIELRGAEGSEILRYLPQRGRIVVLEETGAQMTSVEFARWFEAELASSTREVAFVIGGQDGLSEQVTDRAYLRLSLGRMTWTHEMCRALLLEQIYRAFAILRHIPYHK